MHKGFEKFVHPDHFPFFVAAAKAFDCYILVRETGHAALRWVGKRGYTGKRADMKAKTANVDSGTHPVAGLVCSPSLRPASFSADRMVEARSDWLKSAHLIHVPSNGRGFADDARPIGCASPYLLQNDPSHKRYGCVALVDMGLLKPRYLHGDYDLYDILPANRGVRAKTKPIRESHIGSTMTSRKLSGAQIEAMRVSNFEGPLSFKLANYINTHIAMTGPDLLGALMVNHGEQVNIGPKGQTFEPVLAVMPKPIAGQWAQLLSTRDDHERFYRDH